MKYTFRDITSSLTKKKNSRSSLWVQLWVRKASFPVTYVFINTGWSANMVSVLSWIVIFVAAVLLSVNNFGCMLAGVILTNFWLVLDCVDGNIARVKKTKTFMGDFFDAVAGYGPFSFTTVALGVAAFHTSFLVPEKYRYLLILLGGLSEYTARITENAAAGIGLSVLIVLVAAAVGIFLTCGAKAKPFAFLETEPFETEYGVSGMVRQRRQDFEPIANRLNLIGTILCIVSVLPLFVSMCLTGSDLMYIGAVCLLLGFVALACIVFVYAGTQTAAMEKLLEEGDYTRQRKSKSRLIGTVSVCYWLIVTAIFMFYTFGPYGNAQAKYSWFIWAIAGILYGAVMAVLRLVGQNSKK